MRRRYAKKNNFTNRTIINSTLDHLRVSHRWSEPSDLAWYQALARFGWYFKSGRTEQSVNSVMGGIIKLTALVLKRPSPLEDGKWSVGPEMRRTTGGVGGVVSFGSIIPWFATFYLNIDTYRPDMMRICTETVFCSGFSFEVFDFSTSRCPMIFIERASKIWQETQYDL